MAISRAQTLKELLPGLNALFGLEYEKYDDEHDLIYETESSDRSFEEEVKLSGFAAAPVKNEGSAISYDSAQESFTARYNHETIAMGFAITEEALEDNLYDSLSARYTKALARAMAYTKQVKSVNPLNNGFTNSYQSGDGVNLFTASGDGVTGGGGHPLVSGGTNDNRPSTAADLNETSLENAIIDIAAFTLGAEWIERHFTKNKAWKGTDHSASLEPIELSTLVSSLNEAYDSLSYKTDEILPIEREQRIKLKNRKCGVSVPRFFS